MPVPLTDPFYIANEARALAMKAGRSVYDINYLRRFYKESGSRIADCEIVSATYLAWEGSFLESGVSFEEHASKMRLPDCTLEKSIVSARSWREIEERVARDEWMQEEERKKKTIYAGFGVIVLVGAGAWIYRRRVATMEKMRRDN